MDRENPFLDDLMKFLEKIQACEGTCQSQDPATLYHYTTAEGLTGILRDKSLHASHIRYTNDDREIEWGARIWNDCVKEMQQKKRKPGNLHTIVDALGRYGRLDEKSPTETQRDTRSDSILQLLAGVTEHLTTSPGSYSGAFCASLSGCRDDVYHWQSYAHGGKGFALGFDRESIENVLHEAKASDVRYAIKPVQYDETESKQLVTFLLRDISAHLGQNIEDADGVKYDLLRIFLETCLYFKNPSFAIEKEWRIAPVFTRADSAALDKTDVRLKEGALIPFAKVPLALGEDGRVLPLKEIIIGYGQPFEKTKHAVLQMLRSYGYQKDGGGLPAVERSKVTLA